MIEVRMKIKNYLILGIFILFLINSVSAYSDISKANYTNTKVNTTVSPVGICFINATEGRRVLVFQSDKYIKQYYLTTAFNISTMKYTNTDYLTGYGGTSPIGLDCSPDGKYVFIAFEGGTPINKLLTLELTTLKNISTAKNIRNYTFSYGTIGGFKFKKDDGKKLAITGVSTSYLMVNFITLSTGWNTATQTNRNNFSYAQKDNAAYDLQVRYDGKVVIVHGSQNSTMYQWNLTNAWNATGATYKTYKSYLPQFNRIATSMSTYNDTWLYMASYYSKGIFQYRNQYFNYLGTPTSSNKTITTIYQFDGTPITSFSITITNTTGSYNQYAPTGTISRAFNNQYQTIKIWNNSEFFNKTYTNYNFSASGNLVAYMNRTYTKLTIQDHYNTTILGKVNVTINNATTYINAIPSTKLYLRSTNNFFNFSKIGYVNRSKWHSLEYTSNKTYSYDESKINITAKEI